MSFKVNGKEFVQAVVNRIKDEKGQLYDTNILCRIKDMTDKEIFEVHSFGDVQEWHNDRINAKKEQEE